MRIFKPSPRFDLTEKEMKLILAELKRKGFGAENRTPEHAKEFPELDQFTYLIEEELDLLPRKPKSV